MTDQELQDKIDGKTKPPGSLGRLEELAFRIGKLQNTLSPALKRPHLLVFAGDHGAERSGVSAYPRSITHQMVRNILQGGAAINCFTRANGMELKVVDSGVDHAFEPHGELIDAKVARGTRDYSRERAVAPEEFEQCERSGERIVRELADEGCNVLGFGEMGIGNSASASAIMSRLCDRPIEGCTGMGAGSVGDAYERKKLVLQKALDLHADARDPEAVLQAFGGFELLQMQAAMLSAHRFGMLLLVDGFISSAAFLAAYQRRPAIMESAVFSHLSEEGPHKLLLEELGADPLLRLGMRLGEGTGAAMAWPIVRSAVAFLDGMASFESAGLADKKGAGG